MDKREGLDELTLLGNQHTRYEYDYNPDYLERIPNKHKDRDYFIKFNCPEFTSLCPKTGQPDFATIYISYIPGDFMVESKSLINLLHPRYIEVWGKFLPRGGLSIDPYCNHGMKGTKWEKFAEHRLREHDLYPETIHNR